METKCLKYDVRPNKGRITEQFYHAISMWDLSSTFTRLPESWDAPCESRTPSHEPRNCRRAADIYRKQCGALVQKQRVLEIAEANA